MRPEEQLHILHLKWALDFCQMDLSERSGESGSYLADIKTKIYEFVRDANLQAPGKHFSAAPLMEARSYVGELTDDRVREIQTVFKLHFSHLTNNQFLCFEWPEGKPPIFAVGMVMPTPTLRERAVVFTVGRATMSHRFFQSIVIHRDPVSQSAVALQLHLVRSGLTGDKISNCPECGKIFIIERKGQKYCSPACARAVANRQYYERTTKKSASAKQRREASGGKSKKRR